MLVGGLAVGGVACAGLACGDAGPEPPEVHATEPTQDAAPVEIRDGATMLSLGARAADGWGLRDETLGARAKARLFGAREVPAEPAEGGATYRRALGPGFDHDIRPAAGGARDHLSRPRPPPDGEIRDELALERGIAGLRVVGGGVEMLLANGTPVFRIGGAQVADASGATTPVALRVEGCAVDTDARAPWGRPVVPPGSSRCSVVAHLPPELAYPATFDPLWTAASVMPEPRYDFETATLDDGTVLVVGGRRPGDHGRRVLAFNPGSTMWTTLGASAELSATCDYFTLTKLLDGRLLLAGGFCDGPSGTQEVSNAYLFSPADASWTPAPSLANARAAAAASLLPDGRVLVAGGQDEDGVEMASCEIFDPTTPGWTPAPAMAEARQYHRAVDIGGRVLVTGGIPAFASASNTAEIFDPAGAGDWDNTPDFQDARFVHTLTRLGTDKVLMVGGLQSSSFVVSAIEVFDIQSETWSTHPTTYPFQDARAARGPGGGVLLTGGCGGGEDSVDCISPTNQAIWFEPVAGTSFPAGDVTITRGRHGMATLLDERVVVMGGKGQDGFGTVALTDTRIYDEQPNGEACTLPFQCASGICVDGVCCDDACDGLCEACLGAETGGPDGTCAPVTAGTDPAAECLDDGSPSCGLNGTCADGACASYAGPGCTPTPCADGSECGSGFCVDGVCCDSACDGLCQACSTAKKGTGPDGVCGPVAKLTNPDGDCGPTNAACEDANVCDGASACASVSSLCAPYACTSQGCLTSCSSDLQCQGGALCVAGGCVPPESLCTNETQALSRDGTVIDCAPYRCNPDGTCRSGCVSVDDCAGDSVCSPESNTCVARPAGEGGDEGCACTQAGRQGGRGAFALLGAALWLAARRRRAAR